MAIELILITLNRLTISKIYQDSWVSSIGLMHSYPPLDPLQRRGILCNRHPLSRGDYKGVSARRQNMSRRIIHYNPILTKLARNLRNNSTLAEIILWRELKGKKIRGFDFHRQKPINNFIVDFYCCELSLAIEIDGTSHNEKIEYDRIRQIKLESLGVNVLRFTDWDVKKNLSGVVMAIEEWIDTQRPTP